MAVLASPNAVMEIFEKHLSPGKRERMRVACLLALLSLSHVAAIRQGALTPQPPLRSERQLRRAARQSRSCYDSLPSQPVSFLEEAPSSSSGSNNGTSPSTVEHARSMCRAAKEYEAQSGITLLSNEQRRGCEAVLNVNSPDLYHGFDSNLYGPLWNAFPKMAGALFGRSIFSGCKCEACVYSLDTLIMYLDEDTLGFFNENDINRVLMDRFCYGLKWMYRSACHHIMSDYYPQVVDMLQKYLTGWDVCRHLRFCPWGISQNQ